MKVCPYCAESIDDAALSCPLCKSDLTGPVPLAPVGPPPAKSSAAAGCIIAAVIGGVALLVPVIGILIALLLPAVQQAREAARQAQCRVNLNQIGIALHNYHEVHGSFPPAYIADENGKPMHSWRVLILPFIDQTLYDQYDLSKPWDAPENQNVLNNMPEVYACATDGDAQVSNTTSYAAVTGPNCVFNGDKKVTFRDVIDGTSNTAIVGEAVDANIPWTSPVDVDITTHPALGNPNGFSSHHARGCMFLFGDGHSQIVPDSTPQQSLDFLYQKDDGNIVSF